MHTPRNNLQYYIQKLKNIKNDKSEVADHVSFCLFNYDLLTLVHTDFLSKTETNGSAAQLHSFYKLDFTKSARQKINTQIFAMALNVNGEQ